ncbi:MAG: hypothetical protein VKO26_04805 [Cyanobacteriota bacterium]|nr:hypothetical protein [Cyanobacteriota bacterium]
MVKLCLRWLVSLLLLGRLLLLFVHLRRAWRADALASQFQRELRRRGLLAPSFRLPAS